MAGARHEFWFEEGLSVDTASYKPRHRDWITADIENAAAGGIIGKEPVFGLEAAHVEAKARADDPDVANDTALDQFDQFTVCG